MVKTIPMIGNYVLLKILSISSLIVALAWQTHCKEGDSRIFNLVTALTCNWSKFFRLWYGRPQYGSQWNYNEITAWIHNNIIARNYRKRINESVTHASAFGVNLFQTQKQTKHRNQETTHKGFIRQQKPKQTRENKCEKRKHNQNSRKW